MRLGDMSRISTAVFFRVFAHRVTAFTARFSRKKRTCSAGSVPIPEAEGNKNERKKTLSTMLRRNPTGKLPNWLGHFREIRGDFLSQKKKQTNKNKSKKTANP